MAIELNQVKSHPTKHVTLLVANFALVTFLRWLQHGTTNSGIGLRHSAQYTLQNTHRVHFSDEDRAIIHTKVRRNIRILHETCATKHARNTSKRSVSSTATATRTIVWLLAQQDQRRMNCPTQQIGLPISRISGSSVITDIINNEYNENITSFLAIMINGHPPTSYLHTFLRLGLNNFNFQIAMRATRVAIVHL